MSSESASPAGFSSKSGITTPKNIFFKIINDCIRVVTDKATLRAKSIRLRRHLWPLPISYGFLFAKPIWEVGPSLRLSYRDVGYLTKEVASKIRWKELGFYYRENMLIVMGTIHPRVTKVALVNSVNKTLNSIDSSQESKHAFPYLNTPTRPDFDLRVYGTDPALTLREYLTYIYGMVPREGVVLHSWCDYHVNLDDKKDENASRKPDAIGQLEATSAGKTERAYPLEDLVDTAIIACYSVPSLQNFDSQDRVDNEESRDNASIDEDVSGYTSIEENIERSEANKLLRHAERTSKGATGSIYLVDEVLAQIQQGKWESGSALSMLRFLISVGEITPEHNPDCDEINRRLYRELPHELGPPSNLNSQ